MSTTAHPGPQPVQGTRAAAGPHLQQQPYLSEGAWARGYRTEVQGPSLLGFSGGHVLKSAGVGQESGEDSHPHSLGPKQRSSPASSLATGCLISRVEGRILASQG